MGGLRVSLCLLAALGTARWSAASADTAKDLGVITQTAEKICSTVPTSGERENIQVDGGIRAELDGLLKYFSDAGIGISGKLSREQYAGVLQQDLASALKDNNNCKLTVFLTLQKALLPDSGANVNISGSDNVVSVGQIGGITARSVTINNPPNLPELRLVGRSDEDNPDGSHSVTIEADVVSPFTPGVMAISVRANGLKEVNILPAAVGGFVGIEKRNVRLGTSSYSADVTNPRGHYTIIIRTETATDINLGASF